MPKKTTGFVSGESVEWRLSFGKVRIHNDHLSIGQEISSRCLICSQGLACALARLEEPEQPAAKDDVDKGDGTDKDGDATPPLDNWYDSER